MLLQAPGFSSKGIPPGQMKNLLGKALFFFFLPYIFFLLYRFLAPVSASNFQGATYRNQRAPSPEGTSYRKTSLITLTASSVPSCSSGFRVSLEAIPSL